MPVLLLSHLELVWYNIHLHTTLHHSQIYSGNVSKGQRRIWLKYLTLFLAETKQLQLDEYFNSENSFIWKKSS